MHRGLVAIAAVSIAACSGSRTSFLQRPWPEDQAAVLIAVGGSGEVIKVWLVPPNGVEKLTLDPISERVIVYARVYRGLNEREDLAHCELAVGGTRGDPLGEPTLAWKSGPVELGEDDIILDAEPDPAAFDVRVSGCTKKPASCEIISSFIEPPPTFFGFRAVAALSSESFVAGGFSKSAIDASTNLFRVDGDRFTALDVPNLVGLAKVAVRRGSNIVLAADHRVVEIDRNGHTVFSATTAQPIAGGAGGEDGTILIIEVDGKLHELPIDQQALVDFPAPAYSSTTAGEAPLISVARRDRVLVAGPDLRLYSWNGSEWAQEIPETRDFDSVGIDRETMFAVPKDDQVLVKDSGGAWRAVGDAFLTVRCAALKPLGDGRFIAVGQSGRIVYWNREQLCRQGASTARNIEDVDFFPGSLRGFAVGENQGPDMTAVFLRIEVPPL